MDKKKSVKKPQTKALAVVKEKKYEVANVGQMSQMASLLKGHIVQNELYTEIRNRKYAHVDGWAYGGALMGLVPEIVSKENLSNDKEVKWLVEAVIRRMSDDKIVGRGFALCSNKESKKKDFDEYAVLSMAQTRAIGKAYRNLIGWVMQLSGYESTPSEEMQRGPEKKEATADDVFKMAEQAIRAARTHESLNAILERVKESKKLNPNQKKELERLIGGMVDKLDA